MLLHDMQGIPANEIPYGEQAPCLSSFQVKH